MENTEKRNEYANLLLLNELTRRIKRNPHYSARAFAKSLGISHTLLSLILSGKRRVSRKLADTMTLTLALSPKDAQMLNNRTSPSVANETENESMQISLDTFAILSDWHHYALLSLLELPAVELSNRWIATRLGISALDAKLAMERLKRLGLIAKISGKWKQSARPLRVGNTEASAAAIRHHQQLLKKAEEALESTQFSERDFSSMTFAMDPQLIPIARNKIAAFRRRLVKELEGHGNPSEVYHLNIQIYPITKKEKDR